MTLKKNLHYEHAAVADRLSFFTSSSAYYSALAEILPRAQRRILIVGWSFDDRIHLLRDKDTGPEGQELGELLLSLAEENPSLELTLCIWYPPTVFRADQHISHKFKKRLRKLPNATLCRYPAESALASRHQKYVIVDDLIAFLGGIDLTRERWDSPDHPANSAGRVNPEGETYSPYHDTHTVFSGDAVKEILSITRKDFPLDLPPAGIEQDLWPEKVPVDVENARVLLSLTQSSPDATVSDIHQIKNVYLELINNAEEVIFIENQYFSSDVITESIAESLRSKVGPEVIIFMSRELPDMLGRMTMGVKASMHIAKLKKNDLHGRLGFFNLVSPENPSAEFKIHSKLMITDNRYLCLGSANINQRSLSFDDEVNIVIDAAESGTPKCIENLEARILSQHCGLNTKEWQKLLLDHKGSRLKALRTHSAAWEGLQEGKNFLAPGTIPPELLNYFDMAEAPRPEEVLHTMTKEQPEGFIARNKKIFGVLILTTAVLGSVFFFSRTDIDVREILDSITRLNENRPFFAALLTIVSFWLVMLLFVSISVPIVFFAALHGPWFGILYSSLGIFSGATIFYGLGLLLHKSSWLNRYKTVQRVKKQFEKIHPYGFWAVAITRLVPSGPFIVVNLVTGIMGFRPHQFIAGSVIGLMPGIIAFTILGETIREVFTDPGWKNILFFVLMLTAYFGLMAGIVSLIKKITGLKKYEKNE